MWAPDFILNTENNKTRPPNTPKLCVEIRDVKAAHPRAKWEGHPLLCILKLSQPQMTFFPRAVVGILPFPGLGWARVPRCPGQRLRGPEGPGHHLLLDGSKRHLRTWTHNVFPVQSLLEKLTGHKNRLERPQSSWVSVQA